LPPRDADRVRRGRPRPDRLRAARPSLEGASGIPNGAVTTAAYTWAMADETTDVAALFARLKEEVRAAGPRRADATPAEIRLSARDQAERLWAVSAERPIAGTGGPVKAVLRRLMRWYVEPALADQRSFNDAVLKLYDDLDERISRLERP